MDTDIQELLQEVATIHSKGVRYSQDIVVMEECAELIKEITKWKRGKGNSDLIFEEACDVLNAICVLFILMDRNIYSGITITKEKVLEQMRSKLLRTIERFKVNKTSV